MILTFILFKLLYRNKLRNSLLEFIETHQKFPDVSDQTNLLLMNSKSIVDKLKFETAYFKT